MTDRGVDGQTDNCGKNILSPLDGGGHRVATVREKYLENEIFSRLGKSEGILWMARKFRKGLESQGKVREFETRGPRGPESLT